MSYDNYTALESEEQAIEWIRSLLRTIEQNRTKCDVMSATQGVFVTTLRAQYDRLRMHIGVAQGALRALVHCRRIGPVAYDKLHEEMMESMKTKVIEVVG